MTIYDEFITTKLAKHLAGSESIVVPIRVKKSFWPTDAEKPLFDLYHEWIGTLPTNPIELEKLVMFSAAKMMELALVEKLQEIGLVQKQEKQTRLEMERYNLPITGYLDAVFVDGTPLEIKTFYGDYQAKELKAGKPKTAYLKQLAIYMDFLGADKGKLIYMDRGTGEMYEFTLLKGAGDKSHTYSCMGIEIDLHDVYLRWDKLLTEHIKPKIEPKSEYRYKYPIGDIVKAPKSAIYAARNNKAVYGDWQVKYSPYKNLIIEREGSSLGYSDEELAKIKELTKGYSKS